MKNIYLYPKVFPCENPYINDLEKSLEGPFHVVNEMPTGKGVLNLFRFIFRADIFYFNWIESLTSKRFGKIQVLFFVFFAGLVKALGKKIVWTLHNQYSHDKEKSAWVDFMFWFMFRCSNLIITHSMTGIDFAQEKYPASVKKVKYFIHPLKEFINTDPIPDRSYDFLIWGTIWPYKGVVEFLDFIKASGKADTLRVLIVGKCINEKMKEELDNHMTPGAVYMDEFLDINEIANLAAKSRFILFTYRPESILSSGSLMDSIRMGSIIIGPRVGAFKDLSDEVFIKTYDTFDEILSINDIDNGEIESVKTIMKNFCEGNSWAVFGEKLTEYMFNHIYTDQSN